MTTKAKVVSAIKKSSTFKEAAEALGLTDNQFLHLRKKHYLFETKEQSEHDKITKKIEKEKMSSRINELEKENKKLIKDLALKQEQLEGVWEIKGSMDFKGKGQPSWVKESKGVAKDRSIATCFYSDEHFGEVVKAEQVNGVNQYNKDIAGKRSANIMKNFLSIVNDHLKCVDTDRMVMVLGGDNISGDIHDELSLTNDLTSMEAILYYVECKEREIKELLASGFKQIFLPCVRGNHDRNTEKTHSKNVLETSSAYIVYRFLQKLFANDNRVVFSIATGIDCLYTLNNRRMLLTHGDCFKGGNGIGGITIPILRGFLKKQSNYAATGNDFDSMIIGHFHQYTSINNGQVIINGTLKGFDEYSQRMGFGFQEPCQAFWLTDSDRGITIQLPIFAEDKKAAKFNKNDWVTWKK